MTRQKATCTIGALHSFQSLLIFKRRPLLFIRQAVTPKLLWQAVKDYDMWPIYLLGLSWTIPNQCAQAYLTLTLRSLKFDTFETNLLTVPAWGLVVSELIFWTWVSEKINNRFLIILICQVWMFPLVVGLETLPGGVEYAWSRYVLNIMLVGFPYVHAIVGEFSWGP